MTTQQPDEARAFLISRIRKLAKMTTHAGCTEAEAATALAMVQKLMEEHQVAQDELSIRADAQGCITDEFIVMDNRAGDWSRCVVAINKLYGTRAWTTQRIEDTLGLGFVTQVTAVKFFGLALDVTASISMSAIIYNAVASGAEEALKGPRGFRLRAGDIVSFTYGMTSRLNERLEAMKPKYSPTTTGTGLVALKDSLVREEFEKLGLRLGRARSTSIRLNPNAVAMGRRAGESVNLTGGSNGVRGQAGQGRLS